ncbi:6-hydroxymethylpterin diphosphokinase MptE-like protein [Pseudoclavibacter sp. CFCC 11306]|uniref:6-hydroxymethylpterin diphosphokinase MptE-like protein n=1 Tax=Pseudoclavibacter sp. CFCC 11306 TaxID=1564493 RepID=UPI0013014D8E|nr:6-hydroxymethylpterin diphosphokinase MptE-like protein [Pseudoclavibacter sp. CFCC 11306]KAB1658880.1 DUF115 domain-containing protein [Pseudoclavibacter sp. CFCC 11306]
MKTSIRLAIGRSPFLHAWATRIVNCNNSLFYQWSSSRKDWKDSLQALHNSARRRRCFIIGNGPSLTPSDLELISGEDTFASNQIFRVFPRTSWRPKYYVVQDIYGKIKDEVDSLTKIQVFMGDYYARKIGTSLEEVVVFHGKKPIGNALSFSEDISKYVVDFATVTFTMLQLAVYMGYEEIYLLGMDHSYARTINAQGELTAAEGVKNHFYKDPSSITVTANSEGMERAYGLARLHCQSHGIRVRNVTRGGFLEVFERMSLEEALRD